MGESKPPLLYYNLIVHIISNDRLVEENVALKNIWALDDSIMLDLYFYRSKTSKVLSNSYVHDIFDLTTEKYYARCAELLNDFNTHQQALTEDTELPPENAIKVDFKHLEEIKDDLILLIFVAKCIKYFSDMKKKTIQEYIKIRQPQVKNLSLQYIDAYLAEINPTEADFYKSLDNLNLKTPEEAEDLAREMVKICVSDGVLVYLEKIYIAEVLQTLREHGLEPDVGL